MTMIMMMGRLTHWLCSILVAVPVVDRIPLRSHKGLIRTLLLGVTALRSDDDDEDGKNRDKRSDRGGNYRRLYGFLSRAIAGFCLRIDASHLDVSFCWFFWLFDRSIVGIADVAPPPLGRPESPFEWLSKQGFFLVRRGLGPEGRCWLFWQVRARRN